MIQWSIETVQKNILNLHHLLSIMNFGKNEMFNEANAKHKDQQTVLHLSLGIDGSVGDSRNGLPSCNGSSFSRSHDAPLGGRYLGSIPFSFLLLCLFLSSCSLRALNEEFTSMPSFTCPTAAVSPSVLRFVVHSRAASICSDSIAEILVGIRQ
jgi:hypothetical protein